MNANVTQRWPSIHSLLSQCGLIIFATAGCMAKVLLLPPRSSLLTLNPQG